MGMYEEPSVGIIIFALCVVAIVGWLVIEGILWLFNHISIGVTL